MPVTTHHLVRADRLPQKIKVAGGAALSAVGLVVVRQQLLFALLVILVVTALAVAYMKRHRTNHRSIEASTIDSLANSSDEEWSNLDINSVNIDWEQLTTNAPEEDEDVSDYHDLYGEHDMNGPATPPRNGRGSEDSAQPEGRVILPE
ncbi:Glycerol-3-phosphate acyltransferase domain-containing protein [Pandoravirus kuranda]|uniref:Glycerol-3-phosphate acyltransferase domain-containing protein n=2 Tax=Pandoravirus TaxID=2060084 RepID=A0AA95J6Z3_9VIRU|nr:hypothetical protein pneo_cds_692 [Pandoravirus neocaledonia]AVK76299.1 hypothetical protein pneo_cds_692 [Pandoravirus neocaledonia]WBR14940.1 Glycerol-3-phosphate acyltransferase domain-containing protein [Pandoravirus kuranda]